MYTIVCKYIANCKLFSNTESPAWCSVIVLKVGTGQSGREVQERGHICVHIDDSCCYTTETNTIL